jgi:hypothetical protein
MPMKCYICHLGFKKENTAVLHEEITGHKVIRYQ